MTLPQEIIRAKRDGRALSEAEIAEFIAGLTSGAVSEGQGAAFAMAVFFRGMSLDERVALTRAMTRSGTTLDWRASNLPGPVVDKHSTGGVGDNVSLMLAPMLAACGAYVPMISGRGLGHTGGTLDKLDAIPGYVSQPDLDTFRRVVADVGCAIIGQTADLAPADRRLYAIRDVTATVESIALITASILSKKLAAGLQALVMDVKTGSGAFMPTLEGSRDLAESIAAVANGAGLPTVALITNMDEPLASAAGNALEVQNALDYLSGARRDARLHAVTLALGAEVLMLSGLARDSVAARAALERALASGAAAERFERMVAALGGPADLIAKARALLPTAPVIAPAAPKRAGYVLAIDTREIGLAVVELGGGRARASDMIDPAVGFTALAGIGAEVSADAPLALVHARSAAQAEAACQRLRAAYRVGDAPPAKPVDPVVARVGEGESGVSVLVAINGWDSAPWREALQAALPDHTFTTPESLTDRASIRYAACWRHTPGSLADLPNVQAIFSLGAGVDHLFHDPDLPQVPVVRLVDSDLRDRMSEWVVLHALLHLRQQRRYDRQQRERVWRDDAEQPAAADVRVSIMGLGELGRDSARKLAHIGFDVAGWSASAKSEPGIACFHGPDGLDAMLARTDMLVALLPLTPATRGVLNANLFAKLARDGVLGGPVLLNAGRGGLHVEADVIAALDSGVLAGASLDVFEQEPLPESSPLWRHANVYVSPHNAALSAPRAVARFIAGQIEAFERGEPLRNVVDRTKGY